MRYIDFKNKFDNIFPTGDDFYYNLLMNLVTNPHRYVGGFRLTNPKQKLVQNVSQSYEIKLGDFLETVTTNYIAELGYTNLNKEIGKDKQGNRLNADQVFIDTNTIYLIEMKMRDDHDSTKKRGQIQNFQKKCDRLHKDYPQHKLNASMWFIDEHFTKNKNYYTTELQANNKTKINIYYGGEIFTNLFNNTNTWAELNNYLQHAKTEWENNVLSIPDFDTSNEILQALTKLKNNHPRLYKKLTSDQPIYQQIRQEFFPTGQNLEHIKQQETQKPTKTTQNPNTTKQTTNTTKRATSTTKRATSAAKRATGAAKRTRIVTRTTKPTP